MFYPHDLTNLSIADLEAVRKEWKQVAEQAIEPLLSAFMDGWRCSVRYERTRQFIDLEFAGFTISTHVTAGVYDTTKNEFKRAMVIQVYHSHNKELLANLRIEYYGKDIDAGKWSDKYYLFARPSGPIDWIVTVDAIVNQWTKVKQEIAKDNEEMQRQKLLDLLTKGKL